MGRKLTRVEWLMGALCALLVASLTFHVVFVAWTLRRAVQDAQDRGWNGRAVHVAAYLRKQARGYQGTEGNTRRVLALETAAEGVEKGRDYQP